MIIPALTVKITHEVIKQVLACLVVVSKERDKSDKSNLINLSFNADNKSYMGVIESLVVSKQYGAFLFNLGFISESDDESIRKELTISAAESYVDLWDGNQGEIEVEQSSLMFSNVSNNKYTDSVNSKVRWEFDIQKKSIDFIPILQSILERLMFQGKSNKKLILTREGCFIESLIIKEVGIELINDPVFYIYGRCDGKKKNAIVTFSIAVDDISIEYDELGFEKKDLTSSGDGKIYHLNNSNVA